ncbi:NIC2 [Auxenochlorella protothecoides x Auxenochlorella symbiontica]
MTDSSGSSGLQWRKDWAAWSEAHGDTHPPPPHPTYDVYKVIDAALEEDAGDLGDISALSTIPADTQATAEFTAKAAGVVAGLWVAGAVFARVDPTIALTWRVTEGQRVERGARLGSAHGPARALLAAERVALNFMQRAGGIATATAAMAAEAAGTRAVLLDTRKTAPGLRLLDKWAVAAGGGANHRMGLFDMVMIKDNHIAAAGGIAAAVARAESYLRERGIQCGLEVETSTLEEVRQVISILDHQPDTLVTRIMLDNMTRRQEDGSLDVSLLREALALIGNRRVETEASGNVTLDTVRVIAETGVQFISTGSTTHSVTALDISLNIKTA